MRYLDPEQWMAEMAAHERRADALTAEHRRRRQRQEKHPVFDFLFDYYQVRPGQLRRWHPGVGTMLRGPAPHAQWRDYHGEDPVGVDVAGFLHRRGEGVAAIGELLVRTERRPARFDCFGLHEWAMVYHGTPRHNLPLRLGTEATNRVVEDHQLRCTHYDAFRFFTPPARPLNLTVLSRADQIRHDQGGCVHATMDLYKWAHKLGPLVPGQLLLDSFTLARRARILDMEASPYDVRGLGFGVVAIETAEGKTEYVRRQRELSRSAQPIREALVEIIDKVKEARLLATRATT
ncbi:3-methyladenine DNA glycosylase [Corynebacterium sp. zg-331]|uniref:3-methyladenine DNA glycosylase n=1 Tax=unclassified Corynebacterium TaxID=2624378 RepID=UPI00128E3572|nr:MULTISPECIES: 3-methyladenine DNA glycosylase [unclassified Corynebacterium]MBC3185596.1 3-methyladenine DNA glycosylase [Corynebacterium sp. zg-331]MPV52090.1 3-methyladenine DNA glycosylase [Corynebacterium sp. zg331]